MLHSVWISLLAFVDLAISGKTEIYRFRDQRHSGILPGVCRYGSRLECCYGWKKNYKGHCEAVCEHGCKHGECIGANKCKCYPGFTGKTCNQDFNECGLKPRPCVHRCMNTHGSYKCYCLNGYMLMPDNTCANSRTCAMVNCQYGCENVKGEIHCLCPSSGLQLGPDGKTCVDIDECATSRSLCPPLRKCVNTFGSYFCKCQTGYELKYVDGKYKCIDRDECAARTHSCSPHAICHNTQGSFSCKCKPGFRGSGFHCSVKPSLQGNLEGEQGSTDEILNAVPEIPYNEAPVILGGSREDLKKTLASRTNGRTSEVVKKAIPRPVATSPSPDHLQPFDYEDGVYIGNQDEKELDMAYEGNKDVVENYIDSEELTRRGDVFGKWSLFLMASKLLQFAVSLSSVMHEAMDRLGVGMLRGIKMCGFMSPELEGRGNPPDGAIFSRLPRRVAYKWGWFTCLVSGMWMHGRMRGNHKHRSWVAWILDDCCCSPTVDILDGGDGFAYDVPGCVHYLCTALWSGILVFPYQTVMQPVSTLTTIGLPYTPGLKSEPWQQSLNATAIFPLSLHILLHPAGSNSKCPEAFDKVPHMRLFYKIRTHVHRRNEATVFSPVLGKKEVTVQEPLNDDFPVDCNFNQGVCEWIQSTEDDFDWKVADLLNGIKYYMTVPAFVGLENEVGHLKLLVGDLVPKKDFCLTFKYRLAGERIGNLRVFPTDGDLSIWERTRDKEEGWKDGNVTITAKNHSETQRNIVFEAERGKGSTGEIGLDSVILTSGPCREENLENDD
ncbi:epidermal growth factor-like protein 6 [Narcine bancroftii]|uniref:epidermal growth factor-like protein 6 n=1 Tax=Narcine bancroftii TaxID=1343680 RepID=UPI003831F566